MTNNSININGPKIATLAIATIFFTGGTTLLIKSGNQINIFYIGCLLIGIGGFLLLILFIIYLLKESEKSIEDKYNKLIEKYENIIEKMKSGFEFTSTLQKNELERTSLSNSNTNILTKDDDRTQI